MQRTFSGGMPSISAIALRSGYTPWVCDQIVSVPSASCATAHDGPMEPWIW